ncbi:hypothetical protein B9N43_10455 [Denitratisoma sp. DHT3]|nr:hypothetical protein B9N43_10455 [Denitratisoma sp. DHT3]
MKNTNMKNITPYLIRQILVLCTLGIGLSKPAAAFKFELNNGWIGSFDSTLSIGMQKRLESPSTSIIGNDSGGNVSIAGPLGELVNGPGMGFTAPPDFIYSNSDDGNLNYRKGQIVSTVLKGTHEIFLKSPTDWSAFSRFTWSSDFRADKTQRTPLERDAKKAMQQDVTLLDLWVAKELTLNGQPAKIKLGNQVISWGEDIFIIGGVNSINAVDLRKIHIPGAQLKEIFVPAPMLSLSTALGNGFSTEAYYQFRWNKFILDPAGTYWSYGDFLGKGGKRGAFIPTSIMDPLYAGGKPLGVFGDFAPKSGRTLEYLTNSVAPGLGTIVPVDITTPKNRGQYGINLRYKPTNGDTEYAAYYIRYHDKLPFVGFKYDPNTTNVINVRAVEQYGMDKDLFGLSLNTTLGDWAVGAEVSYRPRDSVAIDPVVPHAGRYSYFNGFGGATPYVVNGYKEERKWQAHLTGFLELPSSLTQMINADEGYFLFETAVTHYPNLTLDGSIPYLLNDYSLPSRTSWGYVAELSLTYANILGSGWTLSPIVDYYHDVRGVAPNSLPFVQGRKALSVGMNFDYHNTWKATIGYSRFWGGGNLNMLRDRDVLSASISYSF